MERDPAPAVDAPRPLPASFRDPGGFLFRDGRGRLLRQVNRRCAESYSRLIDSGLYAELSGEGLLIEHEELPLDGALAGDRATALLAPRELPMISYPYEWPFSGLKNAALLTLEIHRRALARGMALKDASAYNIQFEHGRPLLIDTLSFEPYEEGRPWVAYGQFCRHFLAPLALMARCDIDLGRLLALHIDGVPLELAGRLLPWRTRLRPGLALHLHLHGWMVRRHADTHGEGGRTPRALDRRGHLALIDSLKRCIRRLRWTPAGTEWADYYATHGYDETALQQKKQFVASQLDRTRPATVWDLGANTGLFSRLASERGARTVAFDVDPACVEQLYLEIRRDKLRNLLALRQDLTNPSPALGWAGAERDALADRGPVDLVLALALLHHLAITGNLPLDRIADYLACLGRRLLIEFVPKADPQVQRLLRSREDVFEDYTRSAFEAAFERQFEIEQREPLAGSGRMLYQMVRRGAAMRPRSETAKA